MRGILLLVIAFAVTPAFGQHAEKMKAEAQPPIRIFDDLGDYHHAITTSAPAAQDFFDQGLRFVYAFNHDEATRSFKEAARLDPNCAMAYWGLRWRSGRTTTCRSTTNGRRSDTRQFRRR